MKNKPASSSPPGPLSASGEGERRPSRRPPGGYRLTERAAGVLLHPTSLAGPFEGGDLGPDAHAFVDFLSAAGVRWWQMLPLGPAGPGYSPYSSTSVFAGSPTLVSLEHLVRDGLLDSDDALLKKAPALDRVDHDAGRTRREAALRKAFTRAWTSPTHRSEVAAFSERHAYWLDDFALFASIKDSQRGASHEDWPAPLRTRDAAALAAYARDHAEDLAFRRFVQQRFSADVDHLRAHAASRGVALMGDVPIYVSDDSVEVWAHRELFLRDARGELAEVAGVPPDAFSDEGQRWGNPLYDWDYLERTGFGFWIARLEHALRSFDAVRLDHFIGFVRYYAIPRTAKTAKTGSYHAVPGLKMFEALHRALGPVQLIAEDLGVMTPEVEALRDHLGLPGMSVLQFSFSPGKHAESSRPHRIPARNVVYTGTHDNDTTAGWLASAPDDASAEVAARYEAERDFALRYLAIDEALPPGQQAWEVVRAALRSHAGLAIVPVQDLLGLGRDARMNRPGIADGNWGFRLPPGTLTPALSKRLRALTELYGRAP